MSIGVFVVVWVLLGSVSARQAVSYPVRFTYINRLAKWWPPEAIAASMGVPGFAPKTPYNYIAFAFWGSKEPLDVALAWSHPVKYFGSQSQFGSTKQQIQRNLKKRYNDAGIKLLVSAFGSTQLPTTSGQNPIKLARKLAKFVLDNNFDGVDIDWEDTGAFLAGTGEEWLIRFTYELRQKLPNHIISHSPQAPYFIQCPISTENSYAIEDIDPENYAFLDRPRRSCNSYHTVDQQVGCMIDFYNVQFYNQGDAKYNTYNNLFLKGGDSFGGTSVAQIARRGVPMTKIVVGKPSTRTDATNTGFVEAADLGNWTNKAFKDLGWFAGVMYWQYFSDSKGTLIDRATSSLIKNCGTNKCRVCQQQ